MLYFLFPEHSSERNSLYHEKKREKYRGREESRELFSYAEIW